MFRKGITLLLLTFQLGAFAQQIAVKQNAINFPTTNELQANTTDLTIYNLGSFPSVIIDVDLFEVYGNLPFTVSDTNFTIAPQDSFVITVQFLPEHNIMHNLALVIKTKDGFGHDVISLSGQGTYSKPYYSSTENKSEQALKNALNSSLAQNYNSLSYNVARDNMYATIDNNGGTVECVYTGRTANFTTRSGANSNIFNCEHTFPQGFFNSNQPMRSDIHHLFPTDVNANSRRGNDPFGVVSNASWSQGGSKSGGGKFEPRDVQKGPSARAMMYFVIRYQDYSNHFSGQENILRQWHKTYPPQSAEQTRNDDIYALQNNRNPFVDYPQFEERITNFVSNSVAPNIVELYQSDDTIKLAQGGGVYNYNYVLFNNGNTALTLSNFSLGDPNLSFVNTPGTISLNPGSYFELPINFDASLPYTTSLSFMSGSGASSITYTIPVVSGPGLHAKEFTQNIFEYYPNPADEYITLSDWEEISLLKLINSSGIVYQLEPAQQVDISQLPAGLYILQAEVKDNMFQEKLLVR